MPVFNLSGKTAVIIAGTSVLGSDIGIGLAAQGARIAIVARNLEKSRGVKARIRSVGGEAASFQADTTRAEDLRRCVD